MLRKRGRFLCECNCYFLGWPSVISHHSAFNPCSVQWPHSLQNILALFQFIFSLVEIVHECDNTGAIAFLQVCFLHVNNPVINTSCVHFLNDKLALG